MALLCQALEGSIEIEIETTTYNTRSFVVILKNNGVPEGSSEHIVTFTLSQAVAIGPAAEDIGAADFDQDGNLDLVVSISGASMIGTARGIGDGTFEGFQYQSNGVGCHPYRSAIDAFDDGVGLDVGMPFARKRSDGCCHNSSATW